MKRNNNSNNNSILLLAAVSAVVVSILVNMLISSFSSDTTVDICSAVKSEEERSLKIVSSGMLRHVELLRRDRDREIQENKRFIVKLSNGTRVSTIVENNIYSPGDTVCVNRTGSSEEFNNYENVYHWSIDKSGHLIDTSLVYGDLITEYRTGIIVQ